MSKFMTLEGVTFKKADLKRLETYSNSDTLYVIVASRRDQICVKCADSREVEFKRQAVLHEAQN